MNDQAQTAIVGSSPEDSYDYARIEKAIAFLHEHYLEQPSLAVVAREVHLSEFHFQRLFTRWSGISPKRFLQYLTIEHAKQQLAGSRAVLEATFEAGLSSPGRLHDLFVSVEAVTPGEYKTRGNGICIRHGWHETPFGECLIGSTQRGVCWLSFTGGKSRAAALEELRSDWSGAELVPDQDVIAEVADRIFSRANSKEGPSLSALFMGTNFQIKVWQALLRIPPGAVVTYEMLGKLIGAPGKARAIGNAVAHNRIAFLIPCHRVIRKSGTLGGYRWGENRKRAILGWESARVAA